MKLADSLDALAALERRYDGPIPEALRQVARFGSVERALSIKAEGQADFFAALIRSQIEAIRRARRDGSIRPLLLADLKLYQRQEFWWRSQARRLRVIAAPPSAADAP